MSTKNLQEKYNKYKKNDEVPEWMTLEGFLTLSRGYLLEDETPKQMYRRVAKSSAKHLNMPELEGKFFDYMWKNWICPASPVLSNSGTERGLPISCYSNYVEDSVEGIMDNLKETAMLSKFGGGVGIYYGDIRPRGSKISGNGISDGIIPFLKMLDSVTVGINQGSTRRGATAVYLPIEHEDFDEFMEMRKPKGDPNRQCLNIHHAVIISDEFMKKVESGDKISRDRWKKILKSRFETGEPYLMFKDTVEKIKPESYKKNNLSIKTSNLCSEILLSCDNEHTFVCCLSSMNLARWDEWKDTDAVETAIFFLDGIMEEFIEKTKNKKGFEKARNFAIKSRALGLGVLGFHTYLQTNMLSFGGFQANLVNSFVFKTMREQADKATQKLAERFGEPEWCFGLGRRNTHTLACAPTVSNSLIAGGVSKGIEPIVSNAYVEKTAKGSFLVKNKQLENVLEDLKQNTEEVWSSIVKNDGSVQHLDFLSEEQKNVFLTAREINQFDIIRLAGIRQRWLDQGQSVNLFFPANTDPKYLNQVHLEAWKQELTCLYYLKTSSIIKGDAGSREYKRELSDCTACEG